MYGELHISEDAKLDRSKAAFCFLPQEFEGTETRQLHQCRFWNDRSKSAVWLVKCREW